MASSFERVQELITATCETASWLQNASSCRRQTSRISLSRMSDVRRAYPPFPVLLSPDHDASIDRCRMCLGHLREWMIQSRDQYTTVVVNITSRKRRVIMGNL